MTPADLAKALGCPLVRAANWAVCLTDAMALFEITGPQRQAAFLAQIGHESGRLVYVRELWGPTDAQRGYEGRRDLGNIKAGDGFKYRGRGLIQTTGRANYCVTRDGLRNIWPAAPDFEASPELMEVPKWAALSAAWFWRDRGLNELADAGQFLTIAQRVNGGTNGYADRLALWDGAKAVLA